MADEKKGAVTQEFRLSFPALFKAQKFNETDEAGKFSITMLFPKKIDLSSEVKVGDKIHMGLRRLAFETMKAAWGPDRSKWPPQFRTADLKTLLSSTGRDGWPFRDGDVVSWDGCKDHVILRASSKTRPIAVNRARQPIASEEEIYAGCYCIASLTCYAYDTKGNKGVSFGLGNVQKLREGEPLTGRSKPEDDFDVLPQDEGGEWEEGGAADF